MTELSADRDQLCINTLRFLAVDMVEAAHSGHPGLPLGASAFTYVLWDRHLKFNPDDPQWPDRDRFVLSAGHGCALLYALLHVYGFDLPLAELRSFRQWGSRTPGHPERGLTPGVEVTTGPLGQGLANAVGLAMAEAALGARFNRPGHTIVDHKTYALVGDGDLMEGISSEAGSLAGHLQLGKLIVLYDDNHVSIDGSTTLAFTEDRLARFAAFDWHVQAVPDGNDLEAVDAAVRAAGAEAVRPSFIAIRTHIGYGSPKQDSAAAHGEPLGEEAARLTKQKLGWPLEPTFHVPKAAREHFSQAKERGASWQLDWRRRLESYRIAHPDLAAEFSRVLKGELPAGWDAGLPVYRATEPAVATRAVSGRILNALAGQVPELIGGSADLAPSNKTLIKGASNFSAAERQGRNIRFGVREHAMGAVLNGLAVHGGWRPYGGTFLVFSDYQRPALRLAALNGLPVIYVFTHDSVGLGEDGPTHQPVEHLAALRLIPGMTVIRPADANETVATWRHVLQAARGPVALILSRQNLPILDPDQYPALAGGVGRGAYVLAEAGQAPAVLGIDTGSAAGLAAGPTAAAAVTPAKAGSGPAADILLVATGSEVQLALAARQTLLRKGIKARVVSMPCWNLFAEQSHEYRRQVIPPGLPALFIEAGVTLGWRSYVEDTDGVVGIDRFGASAPGGVVMRELGLSVENICRRTEQILRAAGAESSQGS